jgi:hypothetical protein
LSIYLVCISLEGKTISPDIQSQINQILQHFQESPFRHWDFWLAVVGIIVSAVGLYFSIRAFQEAQLAKQAATAAGRTVKIQTVTIELTEIVQKLDSIRSDISYSDARDLLTETSRRTLRFTAPFTRDKGLSDAITETRESLKQAHTSLSKVRPTDLAKEKEAPFAVYYGVEDTFALISNSVSNLIGLLEREAFDFGDDDGEL